MVDVFLKFAVAIKSGELGYTGLTSDSGVIQNILSTVYFWAGILTVGLIIYGGFSYVLSNGDPGKAKKAKDTILYSLVGMVVVIAAYAITNFVITGVNGG